MTHVLNDLDYEWMAKLRRMRLRHDDQWYGPMKGTKCGCDTCALARYTLDLLDRVTDARPQGATS